MEMMSMKKVFRGDINPDECYIKGSGYKDVPGEDSNPDKDADNDEDDTYEYCAEDEEEDAPKTKKQRKPRSRNAIGTDRIGVTRVNSTGEPVSPRKAAPHYGNTLGVILREVCSINESNIRDSGKQNLRELLIRRVHSRFKFPDEYDNLPYPKYQVNNHAIHKFSKNLSSWKSAAKKEVNKDYSVIKDKWPTISADDWNIFKMQNTKNPMVQN